MDQNSRGDTGSSTYAERGGIPPADDNRGEAHSLSAPVNSVNVHIHKLLKDLNVCQPGTPESGFQLGDDGMCLECRKLFKDVAQVLPNRSEYWNYCFGSHYESAKTIQESSERGCNICTLFIEAYGHEEFEEDSRVQRRSTGHPDLFKKPQIFLSKEPFEEWTIGLNLGAGFDWKHQMAFIPSEAGGKRA